MKIDNIPTPHKFSTGNNSSHIWVCRVTDEMRSLYVYEQLLKEKVTLEPGNIIFLGESSSFTNPAVVDLISNIPIHKELKLKQLLHEKISELKTNGQNEITVDIDYSSFCRWMVMELVDLIQSTLGTCNTRIWYSRANYSSDFPHYGFNGQIQQHGNIRITAESEVCLLSLGLDSSRTYAIWQAMNPSTCVAIYARSPDNSEIVDQVRLKNRELLSSIDEILELPIDDMERAVAILVDLSHELSPHNDIVMIPDGPKPLMLAMAIAVKTQNQAGVYYRDLQISDESESILSGAKACGPIYGFSVS
jgi:hypothetical protein